MNYQSLLYLHIYRYRGTAPFFAKFRKVNFSKIEVTLKFPPHIFLDFSHLPWFCMDSLLLILALWLFLEFSSLLKFVLDGHFHFLSLLPNKIDATFLREAHCVPCISSTISNEPFQFPVNDLCGPAPIESSSGLLNFLTFVVAHSKYTWIYPLNINVSLSLFLPNSKLWLVGDYAIIQSSIIYGNL